MLDVDQKALQAARVATRTALMSGECGTGGAADVAIAAYLAALPSGAEPVGIATTAHSLTWDKVFDTDSPQSSSQVTEEMVEAAAKAICISRGGDPMTLHQFNIFTGDEPFDHEDVRGWRYTYGWRGQVDHARAALVAALSPVKGDGQ